MLKKFAMVKYGVFVAKICKHALCASTVRDIWWSPLARQLLPPWFTLHSVSDKAYSLDTVIQASLISSGAHWYVIVHCKHSYINVSETFHLIILITYYYYY